jgi:hypothetical protein
MKLIERPVRSITRAVADAAQRWTNADFPPRVRALGAVCSRTGYSMPVVEYACDRLFGAITQPAIEATVTAELGSLDPLDDFVARNGSRVRALPIGRVCILSSRTTIGVAVVPAIFALCAKCNVLVKDREDALVAAFFSTLIDELDELRDAAVARRWDGERDPHDLGAYGAVVAFGDDSTLRHIRATLSPAARWIGFGSKVSVGYVAREALADAQAAQQIAQGAARDVVLYDTEGCLSLQLLFVEREGGITPAAFAGILSHAIERAAIEFPASTFNAGQAAAVAGARDAARFRESVSQQGCAYSDASGSYLVVFDPPVTQPPLFLPRTLVIYPVDTSQAAAQYLQRHRLPVEAIAVAGLRDDIAAMALRAGAARIVRCGALQEPPLRNYHGGRPRIAEFVHWVTDET